MASEQPAPPPALRSDIAAAVENRIHHEVPSKSAKELAEIHEKKLHFNRLIDPGIMRPNDRESALEALRTLETISDNLLREPENAKFSQFKPTNGAIQRRIVNVKGALEYAVALGFHSKVEDFQPVYHFNPKHMDDLRIGNSVLKDRLRIEAEKIGRTLHSKETEKEKREAVVRNVKLAYQDDRKAKAEKDEREARIRSQLAQQEARAPVVHATPGPVAPMPSSGVTLSGKEVVSDPDPESSGDVDDFDDSDQEGDSLKTD